MFIKQISIFLENVPGALREMTHLLGEGGVDLLALSIADTANFGIVRVIVADHQIDPALALLRGAGYTAKVNNVLCVAVEDRPGGLCDLLEVVEASGSSVEYLYSFLRGTGEKALMVFRLSDQDASAQRLEQQGVRFIAQEEIDRM